MNYRIAVDTGGTFTDVVVADELGHLTVGKAATTPDRIFLGMSEALEAAADELGIGLPALMRQTNLLTYGTTRATNAIVTGNIAKTAFFTTEGFPDILVMKEGGKYAAHDFSVDFPEPYIPRRHTFEISERVSSEGDVVVPVNKDQVRELLLDLEKKNFEANRGVFPLVNSKSHKRTVDCRAHRRTYARRSLYSVSQTYPHSARISTGICDRNRCVTQARHAKTSERDGKGPAQCGLSR